MARGTEAWMCQHLEYLIVESELPGSGIAKVLSCNLADFSWSEIFKKHEFSEKIMLVLLSLGAVVSHENLTEIIQFVAGSKIDVLHLALNQSVKPLDKKILNSLCIQSLKTNKTLFSSCIMEHGAKLEIKEILSEFSASQIIDQKLLSNIIHSTSANFVLFLLSCLKRGNATALNYCKSVIQRGGKQDFDLTILIKTFEKGNKMKHTQSNDFMEWLLRERYASPNGITGHIHPIDAVFGLPESSNKSKLYYLLFQYDADLQTSALPAIDQSVILQDVTLSALKSGR